MIYRDFQDLHLSLLGFGTMRLPTTVDGAIDEDTTQAMVDYALAHGVNYFDTAWPYMQNLSETVVGRCLKKHPRDSFYLATKYPGHMLRSGPGGHLCPAAGEMPGGLLRFLPAAQRL